MWALAVLGCVPDEASGLPAPCQSAEEPNHAVPLGDAGLPWSLVQTLDPGWGDDLELNRDDGQPVAGGSFVNEQVLGFVPDELLEPGGYRARVGQCLAWDFEVSDPAPVGDQAIDGEVFEPVDALVAVSWPLVDPSARPRIAWQAGILEDGSVTLRFASYLLVEDVFLFWDNWYPVQANVPTVTVPARWEDPHLVVDSIEPVEVSPGMWLESLSLDVGPENVHHVTIDATVDLDAAVPDLFVWGEAGIASLRDYAEPCEDGRRACVPMRMASLLALTDDVVLLPVP